MVPRLGRFRRDGEGTFLAGFDFRNGVEQDLSRDEFSGVPFDAGRFDPVGELSDDEDVFGGLFASVGDGHFVDDRFSDWGR